MALVALTSVGFLTVDRPSARAQPKRTALVGDAHLLEARYANWKETHASRDVRVPLAFSRALSTERSRATGHFAFDASAGVLSVDLESIPADADDDAWIVDDAAGTSAAPDARDRLVRLGELVPVAGRAHLSVQLAQSGLAGFDLDLVVITRAGASPIESIVLSGLPGLFQRLFSRDIEAGVSTPSGGACCARAARSLRERSVVAEAVAELVAAPRTVRPQISSPRASTCSSSARSRATVARAARVTWPRTTSPSSRRSSPRCPIRIPLFVAEFSPDPNFDTNGGLRFENPRLMRDFGLIVESLDGFDDLR